MPGTRINVYRDNRTEEAIRRSHWVSWVLGLSLGIWVLYFAGPIKFYIPILVTVASVPLGWLFGYKWAFAVFFHTRTIFAARQDTPQK